MRTLIASAAIALAVAAPAADAGLRQTCWEVGPTFYLAGIICRVVPDAR